MPRVWIVLLVLFAAALHAAWNALLKGSGDRDRFYTLAILIGAGGAACLLALPLVPLPARAAWPYLCLSVVLHVGYYLFLVSSYRGGDLSQVYPIARGTGPLLLAIISAPLVGEVLNALEFLGVFVVCVGVASLAFTPRRGASTRSRVPVLFAIGTGVFIAAYSLVDGLGVRAAGHPMSYILWMFFLEGMPLLLFCLIWRRGELTPVFRARGRSAGFAGLLAALGYGIVVWAYSRGMIAPIAALRETSVIMAAWLGARLMHEPFGGRRIAAATVVAIGIVLLNLGR